VKYRKQNALSGLAICIVLSGACAGFASPASAADTAPAAGDNLKIDGAARFWFESLSWNNQRKGTLEFDMARLGFKYDGGRFLAAGGERYYHSTSRQTGAGKSADMLFNEYLWAGYRFADKSELRVGQDRMPFGLLPYASNNFFESIAWNGGYEDTYAMGLKYDRKDGPLSTSVAHSIRPTAATCWRGRPARTCWTAWTPSASATT
jgi:hypothetical protein